jgi:hypothetical protein
MKQPMVQPVIQPLLKRGALSLVLGVLCGAGCFAADSLATAIEKAASLILEVCEPKSVVGIVSVKSSSYAFSEYVVETLPDNLVPNKKRVTLVTRSMLDQIRAEQNLQMSGDVDERTAVSVGKLAGASVIVVGTLLEDATEYSLNIKVLDVETAGIMASKSFKVRVKDKMMARYFTNSGLAKETAARDAKNAAATAKVVETTKEVLGFFDEGWYLGYLYSPSAPVGISVGGIGPRSKWFWDNQIKSADRGDYEKSSDSFADIEALSPEYKGQKTAFVWDTTLGKNIKFISGIPLWLSFGLGLELEFPEKLYAYTPRTAAASETAAGDEETLRATRAANAVTQFVAHDPEFHLLVSAGILAKVSHVYGTIKYKYVVGKDAADVHALDSFDLGIGWVFKSGY